MKILSRITSTGFRFPSNSEIQASTHSHIISAKSGQQLEVWDLVYEQITSLLCVVPQSPLATQPNDAQSRAGDTLLQTLRVQQSQTLKELSSAGSPEYLCSLCARCRPLSPSSEVKLDPAAALKASGHWCILEEMQPWDTVELVVNGMVILTCDIKQLQFVENVLLPWGRFGGDSALFYSFSVFFFLIL